MAPRGSPMAAKPPGRGHEPAPTQNHGSDLKTPKVPWKKANKSKSIYFCFLRLCKRGMEKEGPAATRERNFI